MREAFRAAGAAAWAHIIPRLEELEPPRRWRHTIESESPREAVLVAENDRGVVGFAVGRRSADRDARDWVGELDGFYTHPSVWGEGVGRALLEAWKQFARDAGFRDGTLWTAEENHRPRRIYELGGWRLDGARREREHLGGEFVEVRYRLRL
jgi:GNAT superfamily N-acetyltransferase